MMTVGSIVRVKRSTYLLRKGDEGVVVGENTAHPVGTKTYQVAFGVEAKGNYPSVMTVQQSLIELVV